MIFSAVLIVALGISHILIAVLTDDINYTVEFILDITFLLHFGVTLVFIATYMLGDVFRIRKLCWMLKLRNLSVDDKMDMGILFSPLTVLPKRFKSKEFLINSIKHHNITDYPSFTDLINILGVKLDYDIVVMFELNRINNGCRMHTANDLFVIYGEYLSNDDISKLNVVMELLK